MSRPDDRLHQPGPPNRQPSSRQAEANTVIFLPCPELDASAVHRLAWKLERDDIDLILAKALLDVVGDSTTIRPVDGLPLLHVEHPHLKGGARRVVKEVFASAGRQAWPDRTVAGFWPIGPVVGGRGPA
jgi:hypothetical protein